MEKIILACLLFAGTLFAQSYTDMLGRNVEIGTTSRLVFLGPGALRLGTYLGLNTRLAGIEKIEKEASFLSPYRTFMSAEAIDKLPLIGPGGPGKMPDMEALLTLQPDLIVTSFVDQNQIETIASKTHIPIIALSYGASYGGTEEKNLEEVKKSLLFLGEITQTLPRAQSLVAFIENQEKTLRSLSLEKKRVYVGGVGYKGVQGLTSTEVDYPPFALLGLKNCVFEQTKLKGHRFIELEALLKSDPEIIFVDLFGQAKIQEEYQEHKALYDSLSAYKTAQLKTVLGYNYYSTNIENLFVIAWQIASGLGAKVEVKAEAEKIYEAFYPQHGAKLLSQLQYPPL